MEKDENFHGKSRGFQKWGIYVNTTMGDPSIFQQPWIFHIIHRNHPWEIHGLLKNTMMISMNYVNVGKSENGNR